MTSEKPSTEHIEYAPAHNTQPALGAASPPSSSTLDAATKSPNVSVKSTENESKDDSAGSKVTVQSIPNAPAVQPSKHQPLRTTTRLLQTFEDKWIFETLCCVWALCNLLAMIIALAVRQDRSIPSWPYSISINSLISVFTALLKAAMLVVVAAGKRIQCHPFS